MDGREIKGDFQSKDMEIFFVFGGSHKTIMRLIILIKDALRIIQAQIAFIIYFREEWF